VRGTLTGRCSVRARRSRFVQLFRTTPPETVCPNFYVLAHANGCAFSPQCSYCYLLSSFWSLPAPLAYSNVDRMIHEVRRWIAMDGLESHMLNMGNLSDSLIFEEARPIVARLINLFREEAEAAGRPHTLLLVTKGGWRECVPLLRERPCANIIVSFSVNNDDAALRFEQGAPPVAGRLQAARHLRDLGWRVRLRLDPMIAGFDYSRIIADIQKTRPERLTVGSLRAEAGLRRRIGNGIFASLLPPAQKKGLFRYPVPTRMALYRPAVDALRGSCPVALCEEPEETWEALSLDKVAIPCNCNA